MNLIVQMMEDSDSLNQKSRGVGGVGGGEEEGREGRV